MHKSLLVRHVVNVSFIDRVFVGGEWLPIPSAPAKYDKFLRARASILREINNMLQLSEHPNILRLHEVSQKKGHDISCLCRGCSAPVKACCTLSLCCVQWTLRSRNILLRVERFWQVVGCGI